MKSSYLSFIFLLAFLMLNSCKTDSKEIINLKDIQGHWVIADAERDGRKTELLSNGFIEFRADSLEHNLAGEPVTRHYNITNHVIVSNDPLLNEVTILRMDMDTAILSTDFNKYTFKFILVKDEIK